MITKEQLESLVAPVLRDAGAELVQVQISPGGKRTLLRFFVDRTGGITVGECGQLSRRLAQELDREPGLAAGYVLEVSSPGMNRPIWTLEHYRRFAGERVVLELARPHDGRTRWTATIEAVEGERVRLGLTGGGSLELGLEDIVAARVERDPWKRPADARTACRTEKGREQEP